MTISELRDIFIVEYKFECQKRDQKYIQLKDRIIASWIAEAQQDIVLRIKPIKTYEDVSIVANITDYMLDSNFGMPILAKLGDSSGVIGDTPCDLMDVTDLLKADNSTNGKAAIYWDASNGRYYLKVPTPASAYTIRIWHYPDTLFYSPSGSTAQDWGSFSGTVFTGNLKIPDKFQMAIKFYLLGKCFSDKMVEYENSIAKLKVNKTDTRKKGFEYKYNTDYEDEFTNLSS